MSKKTISLVLILGGVLLFIVSLTADYIGIGTYPGINLVQIGGAIIGVIIVVYGLIIGKNKKTAG